MRPLPSRPLAAFTICARNYLAYALTLRSSLKAVAPHVPFFIFLADEGLPDTGEHAVTDEIRDCTITLEALALPDARDMAFRYTVLELATAIKPFCFNHVFDRLGFDRAVYFDPDIRMFAWPGEVDAALDEGAACALTPHICTPYTDSARPGISDLLQSGTFNLGFAAFANVPEARRFLDWWGERLVTGCLVDLAQGLFVDQRYVDLAPSFMASLRILRSKGLNVAYWNLHERPITCTQGQWRAAGEPLSFFHFSGVVPGKPAVFSKHQDRFDISSAGEAGTLVSLYLDELSAHGHETWSKVPYGFARYRDGSSIPPPARRRPFRPGSDPFAAYDHAYWDAPSDRIDPCGARRFTRMMEAIHSSRPDLQAAFPLATRRGRAAFLDWFDAHGARELNLPAARSSLWARLRLAARQRLPGLRP